MRSWDGSESAWSHTSSAHIHTQSYPPTHTLSPMQMTITTPVVGSIYKYIERWSEDLSKIVLLNAHLVTCGRCTSSICEWRTLRTQTINLEKIIICITLGLRWNTRAPQCSSHEPACNFERARFQVPDRSHLALADHTAEHLSATRLGSKYRWNPWLQCSIQLTIEGPSQ